MIAHSKTIKTQTPTYISLTFSGYPCTCPTTVPCLVFFTQPVTPSFFASASVYCNKTDEKWDSEREMHAQLKKQGAWDSMWIHAFRKAPITAFKAHFCTAAYFRNQIHHSDWQWLCKPLIYSDIELLPSKMCLYLHRNHSFYSTAMITCMSKIY